MTVRGPRRFLRTWVLPVLLGAALFGGAALIVTAALPRNYEAHTTLMATRVASLGGPSYDDLLAAQLLAQTYAQVATLTPILGAVVDQLELDRPADELREQMDATAQGVNPLVRITVRDPDPDQAAAIAQAISDQLLAWHEDLQPQGSPAEIEDTLDETATQIRETQARIDALRAAGVSGAQLQAELRRMTSLLATRTALLQISDPELGNSLLLVEPATVPSEPEGTRLWLNVVAAALLGVIVTAGILFAARRTG